MSDYIEVAYLTGKSEWPGLIGPTLQQYRDHVRRLQTLRSDLERHAGDLYLALACGVAGTEALRALERHYFPSLGAPLKRLGFDEGTCGEVIQQVMVHLCTGPHPRILTYAGRASLASWLRVTTLRFGIQLAARTRACFALGSELSLDALVPAETNPEIAMAIERARPQFQTALRTTLDALPERDRTLLRLCFLDGLTIDRIGSMYGVHRATAARWIAGIRKRILESVRAIVMRDSGLGASEFESLALLVRSELQVSLRRVLGTA